MMLLYVFLLFLVRQGNGSFPTEWKNELESSLHFIVNNNELSGTYTSGVGHANGKYPLTGYISSDSKVLSWAILWKNGIEDSDSITAWTCIRYKENVIVCMWTETQKSPAFWNATKVGQDWFKSTSPYLTTLK